MTVHDPAGTPPPGLIREETPSMAKIRVELTVSVQDDSGGWYHADARKIENDNPLFHAQAVALAEETLTAAMGAALAARYGTAPALDPTPVSASTTYTRLWPPEPTPERTPGPTPERTAERDVGTRTRLVGNHRSDLPDEDEVLLNEFDSALTAWHRMRIGHTMIARSPVLRERAIIDLLAVDPHDPDHRGWARWAVTAPALRELTRLLTDDYGRSVGAPGSEPC